MATTWNDYIFKGIDCATGKVYFTKSVSYPYCPTIAELNKDLEEYVRSEGPIYEYETGLKISWTGEIEPIFLEHEVMEMEDENSTDLPF